MAAFGIGCMVQANSASALANETYGISSWITGTVLSTLTAVVILGGIRSIAGACEKLVPFLAGFYILGCVILIVMHIDRVPGTISLIVSSAFTGHAALGGFIGAGMREAMRFGIARGLFSNESGLGSAPIVAAAARTRTPVRQALVSSTGTFWDTVVVCALTGIVIVNSGGWTQGLTGAALTSMAFEDLPTIGPLFLTVGLLTFVFSTILGWAYYGEVAAEYLFGRSMNTPYRILWVIAVFVGSVSTLQAVWSFSDVANGLMAVPNLISLLALSGIIVSETQEYLWSGNLDKRSS